ncbi:MAG: TIR domain-containing protein [Anaerolineae bacterium]|nr:TIR domain-containing protein [Anaerolineae bacterium]
MTAQLQFLYDVFISYADADAAWVEGYLLDALDEAGIDYHTEEAFALGVPRLVEFERAIKSSRRTLLILSQAYLADEFSQFADLLAQTYGLETATWPVIPFVLHPVKLPPRIASLVGLVGSDPAAWEKIIARLCRELQKPAPPPPPKPACPYPGMRPFSEEDSARFFGRDAEIREMIERLRLYSFLAVIGPSGSGKSSLVYAGFLPALRKSSYFVGSWHITSMRPGETPLTRLRNLQGDSAGAQRRMLIVDQFEEAFGPNVREAEAFQSALLAFARQPDCYLVLTVRADFYADLMACPLWDEVQRHRLEVPPMGEAELRQAIVRPAENVDVFVETALIERLIADAAGEPGVLPLVQETLVLLWESVERRFLPARAYEALVLSRSEYDRSTKDQVPARTGLQVAIARRADAAFVELPPDGQAMARRILMRLIQFGEGRADTRRQQARLALRSSGDDERTFERTLRHLVDQRLLTLSGEEQGGDRRVDVAHEALIAGWPRLQGWLDERREAEQTRRRLEGKSAEWARLGQSEGGLLDQVELLEAERWLASSDATDLGYSETLSALVVASRVAIEAAAQEKEAVRQRELRQAQALAEEQQQRAESERRRAEERGRAARRLSRVLAGLAVMFVVALIAAGWALNAQSVARRSEQFALTQQAIALANAEAEKAANATASAERDNADWQRSLAQTKEVEAVDAQTTAVVERDNADQQRRIALTKEAEAREAQAAEKAQRIQTLARQLAAQSLNHIDGQLDLALLLALEANRLSDTPEVRGSLLSALSANPYLITYLHGHQDNVRSVAFSPDGTLLASGGADGKIFIWDTKTYRILGRAIEGHQGWVTCVAFSPDGKILASGSQDQEIILWDVKTRQPLGLPLRGHTGDVRGLAFSPDGALLVSGGNDKTVRLWDVAARAPASDPLQAHTAAVLAVAFSPDGKTIASGGSDNMIILWDVEVRQPLGDPLQGHTSSIYSLAFSPDGALLASGSRDATVRLWDVAARVPPGGEPSGDPLTGHTDRVEGVAFSPDGKMLASASWDETLRVWDVETRQPVGPPLAGHTNWVRTLAFSPDGKTIASGGSDNTIVLWDVQGRQMPGEQVLRHVDGLTDVAFSPDGRLVALGAVDQAVLRWDVDLRQLVGQPLTGHTASINTVVFDPFGRQIVSASQDGTVRLWDAGTGQQVGSPMAGHEGWVIGLDVSPDGALIATGGEDGSIVLWDAATQQSIGLPLREHTQSVWSLQFSPDGKTLASAGLDSLIVVWDVEMRRPRAEPLAAHTNWVLSLDFSPDGRLLASGSADSTIILWDAETFAPVGSPLRGHTGFVNAVAFSADGRTLASGSEDGTVILWDVATGAQIGPPLRGHNGAVWGVAFHPQEPTLASIGENGTLLLWDLRIETWRTRACRRANRMLSESEWALLMGHDIDYAPACAEQ